MFNFNELRQLAEMVARTQYNGVRMNSDQTFLVFLKGQSLGLHPMQAIDLIQVIQGRVTLSPQGMLALINRSKELVSMDVQSGQDFVQVTMTSKTMSHTETFTIADATAMGLITKDNWKKQPLVMLKWRAISACCRVVFPHVIMGMYLTEEIDPDQNVAEDGSLLPTGSTPALPAQTPNQSANPNPPFASPINRVERTGEKAWNVWSEQGRAFTSRPEAFIPFGVNLTELEIGGVVRCNGNLIVSATYFKSKSGWEGYGVDKVFVADDSLKVVWKILTADEVDDDQFREGDGYYEDELPTLLRR